jgi:transposase
MQISATSGERDALEVARRGARGARQWGRYQALLLLAERRSPAEVAAVLGVGLASVYNWAAAWRQAGVTGLAEGPHPGFTPRLDAAGERWLEGLLGSDPQALGYTTVGWTVPLLRREATAAGYRLSAATLRRAIHRLGWRWKRPKYVLGRPDPAYGEKKRRW